MTQYEHGPGCALGNDGGQCAECKRAYGARVVAEPTFSVHLIRSVLATPEPRRAEYIRSLMLAPDVAAALHRQINAVRPAVVRAAAPIDPPDVAQAAAFDADDDEPRAWRGSGNRRYRASMADLCKCGHVRDRHVGGGGCLAYAATSRQCDCESFECK